MQSLDLAACQRTEQHSIVRYVPAAIETDLVGLLAMRERTRKAVVLMTATKKQAQQAGHPVHICLIK